MLHLIFGMLHFQVSALKPELGIRLFREFRVFIARMRANFQIKFGPRHI